MQTGGEYHSANAHRSTVTRPRSVRPEVDADHPVGDPRGPQRVGSGADAEPAAERLAQGVRVRPHAAGHDIEIRLVGHRLLRASGRERRVPLEERPAIQPVHVLGLTAERGGRGLEEPAQGRSRHERPERGARARAGGGS